MTIEDQTTRALQVPDRPQPDVWEMAAALTGKSVIPEAERTDAVRATIEELVTARMTERLTGLASREALEMRLAEDMKRIQGDQEGKHPVTVVAVDLDGFKQINDTLDHAAGDAALRHFGDFMKKQLRPTDMVARTGGDEFTIVLDARKGKAKAVIERLRDALVQEEALQVNGQQPYLSFSFGTREISPDDTDIRDIMVEADRKAIEDKKTKALRYGVTELARRLPEAGGRGPTERARRPQGPPQR